jgi:hypothetical protein
VKQFLIRMAVPAGPCSFLRTSRKTECDAKRFLTRTEVRAAALRFLGLLLAVRPKKWYLD